ncbi:hypothetical protein V3C99_010717 [Haemonchus contortus]|uniref:NAD-dependent protein deacylase n=1 Tax=Haemonchus contortus TaxID=6289 RepID=A0A7I4Y977_HAECO|nr:NAD-dependent histone deacetylase domain containing protein [Haemonchus contortus]
MPAGLSRFVPSFQPPSPDLIKKFIDQVAAIDKLLVLTGAGVSTESGIPDYRSEKIGLFERTNYRPVTIQEFLASESARKRYWSRNFLAWPKFSSAQCNEAHRAIASWERSKKFVWLITQNVDGLHAKAGSHMLTELHGCSLRVKCLGCGEITDRADHQPRMEELNAEWMKVNFAGDLAPDGDSILTPGAEQSFVLPECQKCGGMLKTDVVFFGDNVSRQDVDTCYEKLEQCTGVLVLGSSLTVNTGSNYVYEAGLMGKPVLIVNIGPTGADHIADMRLSAPVTSIIKDLDKAMV